MKKLFLLVSLIFVSTAVMAQEKNAEWGTMKDNTLTMTEIPPVWKGCSGGGAALKSCFNSNLSQHIAKNFKYPMDAYKKNIQGKVVVTFMMNEKGLPEITNITGGEKILQDEARRIVMLIPQAEKPGMLGGKPRAIKYTVPFNFKTGK